MEIDKEWKDFIDQERTKEYMINLKKFLDEKRKEVVIYPESKYTFNAFVQCPYKKLSVVILGQDPYINENQAHGLAFSSMGHKTPPSLKNIFTEIFNDYFNGNTGNVDVHQHNDLTQWAHQGVLLLNTVLTVEAGKSKSHAGYGWETFTENALKFINKHNHKLVFMLWGKDAKEYEKFIDGSRHLILKSDHPAAAIHNPSAWFGNKHFTKCNNFIIKHYMNYKRPINWGVFNRPNP